MIGRYLEPALLPLVSVAAIGLSSLRGNLRVLGVLAILAVLIAPLRLQQFRSTANGADFRAAANVIEQSERPGDAIVFGDWGVYRPGIDYYLTQEPHDVMLINPASVTGSLYGWEQPDSALPTTLAGYKRVWYVEPSASGPRKTTLQTLYSRSTIYVQQGVTVILFRR